MIKNDPANIDRKFGLVGICGFCDIKPENCNERPKSCSKKEDIEKAIKKEKEACLTVDRIKMRITQSVREKVCQFSRWAEKQVIDANMPYVIALNTADLCYPEDPQMPNVISALFGTGDRIVNPGQGGIRNPQGWTFTPEIIRSSGATISACSFLSDQYRMVSGVLFCSDTVIDYIRYKDRDCILVNNPFAYHPIPESFSSHFKNWIAERDGEVITVKKNYN